MWGKKKTNSKFILQKTVNYNDDLNRKQKPLPSGHFDWTNAQVVSSILAKGHLHAFQQGLMGERYIPN